jgi:hypothetical protein
MTNEYMGHQSWEDSQRNKDARRRRVNSLIESLPEEYFKCLECRRFCEDSDASEEKDVCFRCQPATDKVHDNSDQ